MSRIKVGVTWRMIWLYIAFIAIALWMCIGLSGCGTRKSQVDTFKSNAEIREGGERSKESASKSEEKEVTKEENKSESRNDIVTTETTKKYDASGKLLEEHTRTIVDKSVNSSSSTKKSDKKLIKTNRWIERTVTYSLQILTTKEKHKVVDADKTVAKNFGGAGWLFLGLVVVVAAIFLYFYLKRK